MTRTVAAACVLAAVIGSAGTAHAHARSVSYATWTVQGERATVELRLSRLDENALQASDPRLVAPDRRALHLQERVSLFTDGGRCEPEPGSFSELRAQAGWIRSEWEVRCQSAAILKVRSDLLFGIVPGHLHFARVAGDVTTPELVLDEANREVTLAAEQGGSGGDTARRFMGLGISHLLSGWDHVVFVLVLILVAASFRELVSAVSGFTIGHSLSLALASLGAVHPNASAVEALIGLSILLVAIESVWIAGGNPRRRTLPVATVAGLVACAGVCALVGSVPVIALLGIALFAACYFTLLARAERRVALRWGVATLFGMIHGFGFASVLADLSGDGVELLPLLSFNVGVEIGQLAIVAAAWPLLLLARRHGHHLTLVHCGAAAAATIGAFWFASRAWFVG